jgi:hypothetical protein
LKDTQASEDLLLRQLRDQQQAIEMSATQQQELILRIEVMERADKDATTKFQRDQKVLVQRVFEEQATQLKAQFEVQSKRGPCKGM